MHFSPSTKYHKYFKDSWLSRVVDQNRKMAILMQTRDVSSDDDVAARRHLLLCSIFKNSSRWSTAGRKAALGLKCTTWSVKMKTAYQYWPSITGALECSVLLLYEVCCEGMYFNYGVQVWITSVRTTHAQTDTTGKHPAAGLNALQNVSAIVISVYLSKECSCAVW